MLSEGRIVQNNLLPNLDGSADGWSSPRNVANCPPSAAADAHSPTCWPGHPAMAQPRPTSRGGRVSQCLTLACLPVDTLFHIVKLLDAPSMVALCISSKPLLAAAGGHFLWGSRLQTDWPEGIVRRQLLGPSKPHARSLYAVRTGRAPHCKHSALRLYRRARHS